jgi:hypothetical protein
MNNQVKQNLSLAVLTVGIIVSAPHAQAQTTNSINKSIGSDREPPGSTTSTVIDHKNDTVIYSNSVSGSNWTLKINHPPPPITFPYTYKDADTGIIFYIESDGHHVAALDKDGKILWCRQPALDGKLPPYSEIHPRPNPLIVWFGALTKNQSERLKNTGSGKFIGISFNSRQAGMLDVKNGDFTFQGQR